MKKLSVLFCAAVALVAAPSLAAFDLKVTEIWPGNEPGGNLTEDWFEVTNFGDMAWTAATDGDLWFDDNSFDFAATFLMSGIDSIAPGESVIYVDGGPDGVTAWLSAWSPVVTPWQVGSHNGQGLSQNGDGVSIWLSTTGLQPTSLDDLLDAQLFPDANATGGQSYDIGLAAFSTVGNANNAVATLLVNDAFQPAIGSPGVPIAPVPEPASVALAALAGLGLLGLRRR